MRLSLFTPTHDPSFIPRIYEAIKGEPWDEWVILLNNGAKPLESLDARVKIVRTDNTPPLIGALKARACEECTGDILLELDHDDILLPGACHAVKSAFEDFPDVGFVYSNSVHCDGQGKATKRYDEGYGWRYRPFVWEGETLDEHLHFPATPEVVSRIWYAPNHLRAFRTSVYKKVGGYNRTMRVLDDQDLMARMYMEARFFHINRPLYLYRVHGENTWMKHSQEIQANVLRLHDDYFESLAWNWAQRCDLDRIDLGGGIHPADKYVIVDKQGGQINADLEKAWPIESGTVGLVRAFDIFEHLPDPIHTMREIERILAPGGYALIKVPSTDGRGAFQDPTHKSFWNENSFLYYTHAQWGQFIRTPVRFKALRLFTTALDEHKVCWTVAHLVKPIPGQSPGLMLI